jgi:hypothetical protein
MIVSSW